MSKPATEHVWFYEMQADGYSLDDKRIKQNGNGDRDRQRIKRKSIGGSALRLG